MRASWMAAYSIQKLLHCSPKLISLHAFLGSGTPEVALIGLWDPIGNFTHALLAWAKAEYGSRLGIIIITPRPNYHRGDRILYHDLMTRCLYFRNQRLPIWICYLDAKGVDLGANDLFKLIRARTSIRTILLGPEQTLGPGDRGNEVGIREASSQHGIRIVRISAHLPDRVPTRLLLEANASGAFSSLLQPFGVRPPSRHLRHGTFREGFLLEGHYKCYKLFFYRNEKEGRLLTLSVSRQNAFMSGISQDASRLFIRILQRV